MTQRLVLACAVTIAALALVTLDTAAQEMCMNKQWCSSPYSCWKCIEDTARGWEFVGGSSNCPWCQAYECEEYGEECPIQPVPTPEVEVEAVAAWEDATVKTLHVAGQEIVLLAEISPNYPPVEDLPNYIAALGAQCRARRELLSSSVGDQAQQ